MCLFAALRRKRAKMGAIEKSMDRKCNLLKRNNKVIVANRFDWLRLAGKITSFISHTGAVGRRRSGINFLNYR